MFIEYVCNVCNGLLLSIFFVIFMTECQILYKEIVNHDRFSPPVVHKVSCRFSWKE